MNFKIRPRTTKSIHFPFYPLVLFFLFFAFASVIPAEANVSFSWRANPPEDYVIGYRLYYGTNSRFNSSGRPKSNFSYDYYIDFADLERCVPGSNGTNCQRLNLRDVQCENLHRSVPRCTVANLRGQLYFALTAYNAQAESGYTPELRLLADPMNPVERAVFQQVIAKLLLNKE